MYGPLLETDGNWTKRKMVGLLGRRAPFVSIQRTLSRLFLAVGRISIPPLSLFLSTVFTRDSMKRVGIHGINTTAGLPSLDGETA